MTSEPIERLGSALADRYTIERELGQGGMAVVYLAHDLRHDRRVALKVLRPELSAILGGERFLQEIKVTANLQHSHILPLYDSGSADGLLFYVMPYVEGESLRERLSREKQLPVDEAVQLTVQVASALDYAHRHGVIHRDIKPENILLQEGQALVADFGIALAVRRAGGQRLTETGLSLGTPQYMSPEQATADRDLDARSDVYSLACVLYEMLAGEPPHTGPTSQAIIAKLITEEPRRVTLSRPAVPAHVEEAIRTALQKLPADRFHGAAQFADALTRPGASVATTARHQSQGAAAAERAADRAGATRRVGVRVGTLAGALIAGAALGSLLLRAFATSAEAPSRRYTIVLPDSAPLDFFAPSYFGDGRLGLALSPDGGTLIYVARVRGRTQLYVRPMDRDTVFPLAGTEGAADPGFSPDGKQVAFLANSELRRVPLAGGPVVAIAGVGADRAFVWMPSDTILVGAFYSGAMRVPASGGTPVRDSIGIPWFPTRLPGGHWLVGGTEGGRIGRYSLADRRSDPIPLTGDSGEGLAGYRPIWSPSGHLLYARRSVVTAVPFDARRARVLGPPAPIVAGVRFENLGSGAQFALGDDGTLVYASGGDGGVGVLAWADRTGRVRDTLPLPGGQHYNIRASPDGRAVAVSTSGSYGRVTRVTNLDSRIPVDAPGRVECWWPDSRAVVVREGGFSVLRSVVGAPRVDTLLGRDWAVKDVSADSAWLLAMGPHDSLGLWIAPRSGRGTFRRISERVSSWAVFSPDGRRVAFLEVDGGYVAPLPWTGEKYKVAPVGADEPEWSPRGDALFFRQGARWYSIAVSTGGAFRAEAPRLMFTAPFLQTDSKSYSVGPDGRFLVLVGPPEQTTTRLEVITNIFPELRRLAPRR